MWLTHLRLLFFLHHAAPSPPQALIFETPAYSFCILHSDDSYFDYCLFRRVILDNSILIPFSILDSILDRRIIDLEFLDLDGRDASVTLRDASVTLRDASVTE
jgi:hypothetical protein